MRNKPKYLILSAMLLFLTLSIPMITEYYNIFSKNNFSLFVLGWEIKYEFLYWVRFGLIGLIVFATVIYQYYDIYKPFLKFDSLRKETFDYIVDQQLEKLRQSNPDLRLNIMKKKSYLQIKNVIIVQKLFIIYYSGFAVYHLDRSLSFWYIKIFNYTYTQGVCGLALKNEKIAYADLRNKIPQDYNVKGLKLKKTDNLLFILSTPIFKWNKNRYEIRGILNIDLSNENNVSKIFANKGNLETLFDYSWDLSKFSANWI